MYWLLMRPAIGWGAFLLVHAIGIPLVYGAGKSCAKRKQLSHSPQATEG
ncbi:MAG: hypothetical protein P4N59_30015 [Negativicutes bacterium]|nr:hypothetical protein [Negativicutes bacterium]